MKAELPSAYVWLRDALQPHCTQVFWASANKGRELAVGVTSGKRRYTCVIEDDGSRKVFSLNARIAAGAITREAFVQTVLAKLA